MFGYRLDRMNEVDVSVEAADDHLEIEYHGPCKTYPFISRTFLRLSRHAMFHVQGSVYYSPVHVFGDYKWTDERTGRDNPVGIRNAHFLTPLNDQRTRVFTMSFMKMDDPRYTPLLHLAKPFVRHTINKEVLEDKRVLDGLADKSPDIRGLKLSRFDRVVGLHRDRIAKIYRGGQQNPTRLAASFPPDPVSSEQD